MEEHHFITNSLYYFAAALIAVPLFKKFGLGSILGYLAAGVALGPFSLGLINEPQHVLHFAEFGVVMLLFVIGLELAPEKLWRMRYQIGITGGGQLFLSGMIISCVLILLGLESSLAIIIGITLGLSSTAFAVQLMAERNILGTQVGRKGFSILLLQDLAVIPLLLLVELMADSSSNDSISQPWWYGVLAIACVLFVGRYLLNPALKLVAGSGSRELMTAASLFIVLGVSQVMVMVGLSMGLGAFVAGIVLANSDYRHQMEVDIEPFRSMLMGLFFIAVGMTLNIDLLLESPLTVLGLAILLLLIKTIVTGMILRLQKVNIKEAFSLGIMLGQGGEFAFVVLSSAVALGVASSEISEMVVLVVGISMALTSPTLSIYEYLFKGKGKSGSDDEDLVTSDDAEVIIAGFGRFGQIIGRMLAANKIKFIALDKDASHVSFIKKYGGQTYFGDATRIDLLEKAGIKKARVIIIAIDDANEITTLVKTIKDTYPKLKIVTRAHNRMHAYQLLDMGCHHVIRELFNSSLEGAIKTLMELGYTEGKALEMSEMFQIHDEEMIRNTLQYKDDKKKLFEIAHEGRKELAELFKGDLN